MRWIKIHLSYFSRIFLKKTNFEDNSYSKVDLIETVFSIKKKTIEFQIRRNDPKNQL